MEKVTKVFFDPLVTSKDQVRAFLKEAPVGSAHPFRPDGLLLVHSAPGKLVEIDISMYGEEYFSNIINLAELGEGVLERMRLFSRELQKFNDEYMIQQAPAATFKVPLLNDEITIFAVSKRAPTYYDLCIADSGHRTSCFNAVSTFRGLNHSGDINSDAFLLQHIRVNLATLDETPYAIFVSGYNHTKLTRYKEENPVVLIANHNEKVLYVVPVPLDVASIGDAILCVPFVFKADLTDNSLICSILATPTTDNNLVCSGNSLPSDSFKKAVDRADFSLGGIAAASGAEHDKSGIAKRDQAVENNAFSRTNTHTLTQKRHIMLATQKVILPNVGERNTIQIIRFGNGIDWVLDNKTLPAEDTSQSVLPCILGGVLEGPLLLATGEAATNFPFSRDVELRSYYQAAESVVVVVDEHMTDNARNLATSWRMNALFIVQAAAETIPENEDVVPILEELNINAVTALAGPQSLVVAQVGKRFYFYRGIANHIYDTINWCFGQDITEFLANIKIGALMEAQWPRIVSLTQPNKIFLLKSRNEMYPQELKSTFESISMADIGLAKDDILSAVPQLQALLNQKDLEDLCSTLLASVQSKIENAICAEKESYVKFVRDEYKVGNPELQKKKNELLASLRRATKTIEASTSWLTQCLGNLVSSQNTSTRKHDLKRLLRQSAIRNNVEAVKLMTFEKVAGLLEQYAEEMGVLLVNINTAMYQELLAKPLSTGETVSQCCDLDSRILHLEGFDAGIIIEQSQTQHSGPLVSQAGPLQPILALPYLNQENGTGSMLAWVCWDEFVKLEDPYSVRWVEKCNDAHIAALRIIMRSTLSNSISSREYNMTASSHETGHLMASLLMASMEKLARMRTTTPTTVTKATDTSMKLMRGLFGHFLTLAGSGTNPLSKVFQLFSTYPLLDVPTTSVAWSWYENTANLFPYTGWPRTQFEQNLEKLLDKVIFRLITKNKIGDRVSVREYRLRKMQNDCRIRNIQLLHLRTIVMAIIEINKDREGYAEMASNLLRVLPAHVEKETRSYTRLYAYIKHLADGGEKRQSGNLTAANVFTKRFIAFKELKMLLSEKIRHGNEGQIKDVCQKVQDKHREISQLFDIDSTHVNVQGLTAIQTLLDALATTHRPIPPKLLTRLANDAEIKRQPWQLGTGASGLVPPLDHNWLHAVLHDAVLSPAHLTRYTALAAGPDSSAADPNADVGWARFDKLVKPEFLKRLDNVNSPEAVCALLDMPPRMMRTFMRTLAPACVWERLPAAFLGVVRALLETPNQETGTPGRWLLGTLVVEEGKEGGQGK